MAAEDLLKRVGSMDLNDVGDEVERLRKENEALKRKVTSLEVAKDGAVGKDGVGSQGRIEEDGGGVGRGTHDRFSDHHTLFRHPETHIHLHLILSPLSLL